MRDHRFTVGATPAADVERIPAEKVDDLLKPFPIKEFHPFPRVMIGPGAHETIGPAALKLGFTKTLVMTSGLRGTDTVHTSWSRCATTGLRSSCTTRWSPTPKDYNVMDAVAMYSEAKCDSFVSIGGGCSHDA